MEPRAVGEHPVTRRPRAGLDVITVVALGGALGTIARYEVAEHVHVADRGFPLATFLVNLAGAFVLGAFLTFAAARGAHWRLAAPFVAVGLLGGFTTFSSLAVETALLAKDGRGSLAAGYLVGSLVAGVVLAAAGAVAGRGAARLGGNEPASAGRPPG